MASVLAADDVCVDGWIDGEVLANVIDIASGPLRRLQRVSTQKGITRSTSCRSSVRPAR